MLIEGGIFNNILRIDPKKEGANSEDDYILLEDGLRKKD